jgi:hypothetical protein
MDAKNEENYWREQHDKQPFAKPDQTYEHYAPAYRTGYEGSQKYTGKKFEEIEADLAVDYEKHKSALPWDDAKEAVRLAWDKMGGVIAPRDVDRGVRYD